MRIGVCTGLSGMTASADGLALFESTVGELLCPAEEEAAFEHRLVAARAATLPVEAVNCLFPGSLRNVGSDVDPAALDEWMTTTCRRAARVGVEMIVFGSGGSRMLKDGFDRTRASEQIVENLKRYGPIAAARGVTIVLEPLNTGDCNFINSVDEGAELVRAADHPNIRLLVDTYHMAKDDDPAESIRRAGELIAHAHCAEGASRGPLGTTGEDQRPYFRALKDIGYEGRISIECTWDDYARDLPAGVAELRRQWEEA